MIMTRYPSGQI